MSISKAQQFLVNLEQKDRIKRLGKSLDQNSLKSIKMTHWFKKKEKQSSNKYTATFDERKQLLELEELFTKFDEDGSGGLDLDELVDMFQMAGLRISGKKLKEMFHLAKSVKIVDNELDLEQFQKLMLSPELEQAFRKLLKEIRRRFKYNDFSMVDPEVGYLPSDLGLMLGYLYKRSIRKNLQDQISSDKIGSTQHMTSTDLHDSIADDYKRFTSLFHLHDDARYDQELRQKYRIGPIERRFRQDQNPEKRQEKAQLRAITTFFLNRIKDRATNHQSIEHLVDRTLINSKIPNMQEDREMRMMDEFDKVEISIENLHKIQEERRIQQEQKARASGQFTSIMRGLTLTKRQSSLVSLNLTDFTQSSPANGKVRPPIDCKTIKNKEERQMFELLDSLNDNLQILDGVRQVFEKDISDNEDDDNYFPNRFTDTKLLAASKVDTSQEAMRIIEGIPEPKKVLKGKATFIVAQKPVSMSLEERAAKRNAKIAKMMHDSTDYADQDSSLLDKLNQIDMSYEQDHQRNSDNQTMLQEEIDKRFSTKKRNAQSMLQQSYFSSAANSPMNSTREGGSIILDSNKNQIHISALGGKAVSNQQHSNFKNPFNEQLELDSKELMIELLDRNKNGNLTEFQKQTLKNLRNSSKRSKMIVFGDCVDQFEHMVDRRSKLYSSMQGFKKVNLEQSQSNSNENQNDEQGSTQVQEQSSTERQKYQLENSTESGQSVVFASAAGVKSDGSQQNDNEQIKKLLQIVKSSDTMLDQKRVLVHQQVQTPVQQSTDSLFSLNQQNNSSSMMSLSKFDQLNNRDIDQDLQGGAFKQGASQTVLQPIKNGKLSKFADQTQQHHSNSNNNLSLMSQKMKLYATPKNAKRNRHNLHQYQHTQHQKNASVLVGGEFHNLISSEQQQQQQQTTQMILQSQQKNQNIQSYEMITQTSAADPTNQNRSHQLLPAIHQNPQHQLLQQSMDLKNQHKREVLFSTDKSETSISQLTHFLKSQKQQAYQSQQVDEPEIEDEFQHQKMQQQRFRGRNLASRHIKSKNSFINHSLLALKNSDKEASKNQQFNWSSTMQDNNPSRRRAVNGNSTTQIDYNFGGYVSKTKPDSKKVVPSFFNSKQADKTQHQTTGGQPQSTKGVSISKSSAQIALPLSVPKQSKVNKGNASRKLSPSMRQAEFTQQFQYTSKRDDQRHSSSNQNSQIIKNNYQSNSNSQEWKQAQIKRQSLAGSIVQNVRDSSPSPLRQDSVVNECDRNSIQNVLNQDNTSSAMLDKSRQQVYSQISANSSSNQFPLQDSKSLQDTIQSIEKKNKKRRSKANKQKDACGSPRQVLEGGGSGGGATQITSKDQVTKITINAPQVNSDITEKPPQTKQTTSTNNLNAVVVNHGNVPTTTEIGPFQHENYQQQPNVSKQIFPSLGASSLNLASENSVSAHGQPTLQAAQARSMSRKIAILTTQANAQKIVKKNENATPVAIGGINGILGDSIQQSIQESSKESYNKTASYPAAISGLKQNRWGQQQNNNLQNNTNDSTSQMVVVGNSSGQSYHHNKVPLTGGTNTEQSNRLLSNYSDAAAAAVKDEQLKSLETGSYDNRQPIEQIYSSLVSSSSGRGTHGNPPTLVQNSTMNMNESRPLYNGKIQQKEAPQSSMNVVLSAEGSSGQAIMLNKQDFSMKKSSAAPTSIMHQTQSQFAAQYGDQTYLMNMSKKSIQSTTVLEQAVVMQQLSDKEIEEHQLIQKKNNIAVAEQASKLGGNGSISTHSAGGTPFMKFQERIKKLNVNNDNSKCSQSSIQQVQTPIFQDKRKNSREYESNMRKSGQSSIGQQQQTVGAATFASKFGKKLAQQQQSLANNNELYKNLKPKKSNNNQQTKQQQRMMVIDSRKMSGEQIANSLQQNGNNSILQVSKLSFVQNSNDKYLKGGFSSSKKEQHYSNSKRIKENQVHTTTMQQSQYESHQLQQQQIITSKTEAPDQQSISYDEFLVASSSKDDLNKDLPMQYHVKVDNQEINGEYNDVDEELAVMKQGTDQILSTHYNIQHQSPTSETMTNLVSVQTKMLPTQQQELILDNQNGQIEVKLEQLSPQVESSNDSTPNVFNQNPLWQHDRHSRNEQDRQSTQNQRSNTSL